MSHSFVYDFRPPSKKKIFKQKTVTTENMRNISLEYCEP